MKKLTIRETPYYSLLQGGMSEGCQRCVRGEKLVLFATGVCPAKCFYCPISPEKKMKDIIFANERMLDIKNPIPGLIEEVKASGARGAGITGGDPLARLGRTCSFIRALKKEFGIGFHIHLYTTPLLVNGSSLKTLYEAGLDEIRFHPLDDESKWPVLLGAKGFDWSVGFEIPVLPDNTALAKKIVDFAAENQLIDFLNINELEVSELNYLEFAKRHYSVKSNDSYGIEGSKEAAIDIMSYAGLKGIPVHYCTTTLKDKIQMGNRIKKQAELNRKPFDIVDDGLLIRGAVYFNFPPGIDYQKKILDADLSVRDSEVRLLNELFLWLRSKGMPKDAGLLDKRRLRVLLSAEALRDLADDITNEFPKARPFIIKEYPTYDSWIVEAEPL